MDDVPRSPNRADLQANHPIGSARPQLRGGLVGVSLRGKLLSQGLGARTALAVRSMGIPENAEIDLDESFSSTGYSRTFLGLPRGPVAS